MAAAGSWEARGLQGFEFWGVTAGRRECLAYIMDQVAPLELQGGNAIARGLCGVIKDGQGVEGGQAGRQTA